jgi:hypothetical protein
MPWRAWEFGFRPVGTGCREHRRSPSLSRCSTTFTMSGFKRSRYSSSQHPTVSCSSTQPNGDTADLVLDNIRKLGFDPAKHQLTRDLVLNDNDVIKLGDTSVKVHATPGHSAGAVAFPHLPFLSNHSERSRQNGTGNVCFQQGRYCLKCTARLKNASTHEFSQYTADINLQL